MKDPLWIVCVLLLALIFFVNWWTYPQPYKNAVTEIQSQKIIQELRSRSAGDCVVTDKGDYWQAKEMETNKIYRIKK